MREVRKTLVEALDQALKLASTMLPARIHVLTVLSNDLTSHRPTYIEAAQLDSALERLAARTGTRPCHDLQIFTHARIGSPSAEILELAQEVRAQLIVVGTHRRQGIKRLALGSVAEAVILGCTELCLLIQPEDSPRPLYDTTRIHAEAILDFALK